MEMDLHRIHRLESTLFTNLTDIIGLTVLMESALERAQLKLILYFRSRVCNTSGWKVARDSNDVP